MEEKVLSAIGPLRLHHIGVVVDDLETAAEHYTALGFGEGERFSVPEQAIEAIVYGAGEDTYVELITPTDDDGPIARFMGKRGEGMHHVAYRVDDVAAAIERLREAGVSLIDDEPREGTHGWMIAFVHPESTHGVLTELVQVR